MSAAGCLQDRFVCCFQAGPVLRLVDVESTHEDDEAGCEDAELRMQSAPIAQTYSASTEFTNKDDQSIRDGHIAASSRGVGPLSTRRSMISGGAKVR